MPIRSGIGIGAAQIYNQPSALVNTYGKLLQQQAQENAKFQNELADLIGKVKTEGARDIDKPLIAKAYDEVKELYRQSSSVRNSTERNLIRSQLTSGIQSLNEAAARSAQEAKLYTDTLSRVATTGQFLYDPNKLNEFKLRINKPITELTVFNPLDLERIPDDSIRDKAYDNIYTELKNKSVYKTVNIGGGKEQEIGVVNPTIVTANIIERIGKSPEWLNLATRNYVQANPGKEPRIEDIIDTEVKLYMNRRGNEYTGTPSRIPKATGGEAPDWLNNPNPVALNIPFAGGKASVDSQNYIGLSIPNKNFAGSSAIDLTTGSPVKSLTSSNDYQIVGIGNFPTITSGNFKGSLAQPDYESKNPKNITYKPLIHVQQIVKYGNGSKTKDLLIPFDRLPANVKSSKALDKVLRNFRPSSGKSPVNPGSGKDNTDPLNILNP
jgi:hypothetical protein